MKRMKRVVSILILAAVLAAVTYGFGAAALSASAAPAEDDYAMQVNLSNVMCSAPISVAYLMGYFLSLIHI